MKIKDIQDEIVTILHVWQMERYEYIIELGKTFR
jgi:hypothetical protein